MSGTEIGRRVQTVGHVFDPNRIRNLNLSWFRGLASASDSLDLFAHEPLGRVDDDSPHRIVRQPGDDAADDLLDDLFRDDGRRRGQSQLDHLARCVSLFGGQQRREGVGQLQLADRAGSEMRPPERRKRIPRPDRASQLAIGSASEDVRSA